MSKTIINTTNAPAPIGPYNQAVKANGMLYISGQIAIVPATRELEISNIYAEAHQVMLNLKAILNEAGLGFEHVVKTTILLTSMDLFARVNEIYASYFVDNYPARETFAVKGLPKNVNVEISMIAVETL
ncbi:MAG: RidA family protein [Bacteroidetes bacterium]|nr:RidA family protein [Bacteroidota bacterium]